MQWWIRFKQHSYSKQIIIAIFFGLSALGWFGMWIYGKYYLSTDDAYVNANVVQITPRITGKINELAVRNNQYIKQGQPLLQIDSVPFQLAIDSAQAQVDMHEAQVAKFSQTDKRTLPLVKNKYLSAQEGDNVTASLKTALAELAYAKAGLAEAELNKSYTTITAPTSGWITNLSIQQGDVVPANQPLFALISDAEFWIDANFKETELQSIRPGQLATIVTDLYPNHPFKGVVESISGGAGAAFSLLPPQNASGNWVKVTQRVPVRVRVLNPDSNYPLRVGISAEVTIHLHSFAKES